MMNVTSLPAEWKVAEDCRTVWEGEKLIAQVGRDSDNSQELLENAHLIAATRELLDACEEVLQCPTDYDANGHAFLKVDARSIFGTASLVQSAVQKARAGSLRAADQ